MQQLDQNTVVVEVPDLAPSSKQTVLRILHVDDDPSLLEISKEILMDMGAFDICNACCVDEAFKKLSTESYDAVISDYEMPQKNGLDFLKELREKNNQIPFILFTGKGREDVAVKALNLGVDSYIDKNGSPGTVYGELAHAINKTIERKKSAQLLATSESKYRLLVEKSLQGIMIAQNTPLRIAFANTSMGKMLGYKPEEFISLSPARVAGLVHQDDRAVFFERFKSRLEGKETETNYEFRAVRKDGSILWMEVFSSAIKYNGKPAVQAMFLDIDERKKTEEITKRSEARYRELANFLPGIVFETDLSGKITFFSQRALETSGFSQEEQVKGMHFLQFLIPQDRERAKENVRRRLAGEETDTSEYTVIRKSGDTYPAIIKTAPIFSENRVVGLRGFVIDITERKMAENKLQESQKITQKMLSCSPNLIYIYDLMEKCNVYANKEVFDFLGYTPDQVKSMGSELFAYIMHPDDAPVVAIHHARFANAPDNATYDVEYRMKHSNGEWRWLRSRDTLFTRTPEGLGKQILRNKRRYY